MKRTFIIAAVIMIVLIGAGTVLVLKKGSAPKGDSSNKSSLTMYDACHFLTKEKASALLATNAVLKQEPAPANSDDLKVTSCVYSNNTQNIPDTLNVSVVIRSPLTQTGSDSNIQTFNDTVIVGDTPVSGYGDKASWNAATGQLNILKEKNWVTVNYGKIQATAHALDEAKKVATELGF